MKNKKGVDTTMENIVFLLIVIIFVSGMLLSITRVGSQAGLFEQIYSKQIALIINKAESGMKIEVDMFDVYRIAKENKLEGNPIHIDNVDGKVNVRLINGEGYDYFYFSDNQIIWNLIEEEQLLILEVVEKNLNDGVIV